MELTKSMLDLNFEKHLGSILCATMIICGAKDKINKKAAVYLAKNILQAQLQILEDAGHEVNIQAPMKLAQAIKTFYKV